MAGQILLVCDDDETVVQIKRALAADGYAIVVAASVADAVIAYGNALPSLVILSPGIEGDRGAVLLEELRGHPDAGLLKVLLLGETIPGFGYPIVPLPIEPRSFSAQVTSLVSGEDTEAWTVQESQRAKVLPSAPFTPGPREREAWRAGTGALPPAPSSPSIASEIADSLNADAGMDDELVRLGAQVRAEARVRGTQPAVTAPLPPEAAESSFESLNEAPAPKTPLPYKTIEDPAPAATEQPRQRSGAPTAPVGRASPGEATIEELEHAALEAEERLLARQAAERALAEEASEYATRAWHAATGVPDVPPMAMEIGARDEQIAGLERELGLAQQAHAALEARLATLETVRVEEGSHAETLLRERDAAFEALDKAGEQTQALTQQLEAAAAREIEHAAALERLQGEINAVKAELKAEQARGESLRQALEAFQNEAAERQVAVERLQVEKNAASESIAQVASEAENLKLALQQAQEEKAAAEKRAAELASNVTFALKVPGRKALGVPRQGEVDLEGTASLVSSLVLSSADVKVEFACRDGRRTVWLSRGRLVAAESDITWESMLDRARRDGLIDGRTEKELSMLKGSGPQDTLSALEERGYLKESEVVPLAQRYVEHIALEAWSERSSTYRLTETGPQDAQIRAASPSLALPLLAEALRRALAPDEILEGLGGLSGVLAHTEHEIDARGLGFSDRDRRLLALIDGELRVETVLLESGLAQTSALKALGVARLLGMLQVVKRAGPTRVDDGEVDLKRLDAMYERVQDADYFSILGLNRTAGTEEVQRAFERLRLEFDPIRFAGHPDGSFVRRAEVVMASLSEAARALEDDRRRAEYARHLIE